MEGKIGTTGDPKTDEFYGKLRTDLHLLSSGLNRAHFGGRAGANTLKYFDDLVGGAFRSEAALNGMLDSASEYLHTYSGATPQFGEETQFGGTDYSPTATQPLGNTSKNATPTGKKKWSKSKWKATHPSGYVAAAAAEAAKQGRHPRLGELLSTYSLTTS